MTKRYHPADPNCPDPPCPGGCGSDSSSCECPPEEEEQLAMAVPEFEFYGSREWCQLQNQFWWHTFGSEPAQQPA